MGLGLSWSGRELGMTGHKVQRRYRGEGADGQVIVTGVTCLIASLMSLSVLMLSREALETSQGRTPKTNLS